jgi:secreted trypsin-like serine protease
MRRAICLLGLIACGRAGDADLSAPETTTSTEQDALQGGVADASDPAVGLLWIEAGGFCSGTLIAPDVVLTAGHCTETPIAAFYLGEGQAINAKNFTGPPTNMRVLAVAESITHPDFVPNSCTTSPDIGLVRLAQPASGVHPVAFAKVEPAIGSSCTAVGFGMHTENGATTVEQKRSGQEKIEQLYSLSIQVGFAGALSDHGDSGGPLLCNGSIAGVTSCGNSDNVFYTRIDQTNDWIARTLAKWEPTLASE